MAKFLVVEDEAHIRELFLQFISDDANTSHEATGVEDIYEALEAVESSIKDNDKFDLILLDHNLGDKTGLNFLEKLEEEFGSDYFIDKFIVMTGYTDRTIASNYSQRGSIAHILKPVSKEQFLITIDSALIRIENNNNKIDWQLAIELLDKEGILPSIDKVETQNQQLLEQYEILKSTYEKLLNDIQQANNKQEEISKSYEKALTFLNSANFDIESIKSVLDNFEYTPEFWKDIESLFKTNRVQFFILQNYLSRLIENSVNPQCKKLAGLDNYSEFRVGRDYRLYYSKFGSTWKLERFGNKNIQNRIIRYLRDQ